ncbi:MAG: Rrf2 family transcriptional regulator [Defluviicoccus sp.]|nr:MAG: Rrf2 family transcriptional regulator [Defluviicoccus sp.]
MKLSTKGRYAVMAMADLAFHSKGGKPVALAEVADRQEISLSYLEQLFGRLRRSGLVNSVRGPGGGYMLARDLTELRIADIILAVDEPIKATRCTPGAPTGCHSHKGRCLTHDLWEELGNQIYLYLSSVTLADVCERRILGSSRMMFGSPVTDRAPERPVDRPVERTADLEVERAAATR